MRQKATQVQCNLFLSCDNIELREEGRRERESSVRRRETIERKEGEGGRERGRVRGKG